MSDRIYRFAEFELLSSEGELRTGNSSQRLQEKPLLLLTVLLDHPQRLVTRDQLRERMWDRETFVDYEQGINVAIKKVRDALGDSAENPKFIETIAKKGYRFLIPVEVSCPDLTAPAVAAAQPVAAHAAIADASSSPRHSVRRRWIFAALAAAVLCALGLWFLEVQARQRHSVQIHSIAVLPLRNLSPDSGQEYFADGITEELITDLAQSLPLRVISRTSVMRYKDTKESITQIARELGVEAIVEGAVARSGNRVTVTIQVIDATEDRHLWAQTYDRNLGDLLGMEAELSQEIARQVGGTLNSQGDVKVAKSRAADPRVVDPQVYDLCLMGRYHWNKRTAADLAKSAEYFQQAIDRDPKYAPAYAGLANVYALMPHYDSVELRDNFAKAVAAARHALELDDTLAEPHATLGLIQLNRYGDWMHAEPEFQRALELNPNYATAHHWFAFYLVFSERRNEGLAEMERARQLDPLSAIINADEGHFLFGARRYDEAKARLRQAIELAPDLGQPHQTLALIDLETGQASDALNEARIGLALDPNNPRTIGEAGYVLAAVGQPDEARKLLVTLQSMVRRGTALPTFAAMIQMGLGQRDEALDSLAETFDPSIGAGLQGVDQWHIFDPLHADSRYQKLVAQPRKRDSQPSQ
jgi:TolB-like protein/DNA-binding winged helix-turn-helix (wHTH) protein/Tfp pilus assembly protein PilF